MKQTIHIVLTTACLFLAGKSIAQHTYGSFYTNDSFVNYILAKNKTKSATIVMVPGHNLSTYTYVTTPDGRKGWAELFADKGYDVYMVNDPKFDFATGGFVSPYTVPANGKPATPGSQQGWQSDIWKRWGFGTSQGTPYPDALFPTNSFNVFAQNYPYIGTSSKSYVDALNAVIDSVGGKVWLLAHSAGAQPTVAAARQKKTQVNGLILIEPAGPPAAGDFPDLNGLHMFGVYGDYLVSRNQVSRMQATENAALLFQNAGGVAGVVSLPEDSLVKGNSHILMQDLNSHYVFNIIEHWLRPFNVAVGINSNLDSNARISLGPNPTYNEVGIEGELVNGHKYSIYSADGRVLRESTVVNQKIDLSDLPNGLLFIKLIYKDQLTIKRVIKNNEY